MNTTGKPQRFSHAFSLVGILVASVVLLAASSRQWVDVAGVGTWERIVFRLMMGYLVLVSARTACLVVLSFADRFFRQAIPPLTSFPLVSVLVPCFNEQDVVEKAVRSILKLDYPNFEVLVIDDGSTDQTLRLAHDLRSEKRVRVIHQRNQGKAAALNRGILEAYGEFVLCVDADSLLHPGVLRFGLPYFDRDPKLAAVAGAVHVGNPHNLITAFQRLEYVVGLNFHKTAQSFLSVVTIVPGPVGLFRKDAIRGIGGYRSDTFAEDCDLTIRLLMAGHHAVYCDRMIAVTEAPDEFESLIKQRYRWSRGTLQAIKVNARWLFHPWKSPRNFAILSYLFLETLIIPCANFLFAMVFVQQSIASTGMGGLSPFFIQLTLLDTILAAYSVLFEHEVGALVFLSLVNRLTYGLAMEILRFFSILDELIGLPMNWNKLQRKGL